MCPVIWFRNKLFDYQIIKSFEPNVFTICVGNLSVGGTGKTPMVEYLVENFTLKHKTAILSRGYGRKTKGFIAADAATDATIIGDEPYQYWLKLKNKINIFVGENRVEAFCSIIKFIPDLNILILDDGFQHRKIKAHINIILIDYNNMIDQDWLMPSGKLREPISGINRAQVIIITKCPAKLSIDNANKLKNRINNISKIKIEIYFATIEYGYPVQFNGEKSPFVNKIVIASGLANSSQFDRYCYENYKIEKTFSFGDHHDYKNADIVKISDSLKQNNSLLVTEKDYVKLIGRFSESIIAYYLPIKSSFLFSGHFEFMKNVQSKFDLFQNDN